MNKPKQRRLKCGCVRNYEEMGTYDSSLCEKHEKEKKALEAKYKQEQADARLNVDMCLFELDLKTVKGESYSPGSCERSKLDRLKFKYAYAVELFKLWQLAKQRGETK